MKISRQIVDVDAIADGMLAMTEELDDSYQVALRFGMLPAPLMDGLKKNLENKAREVGEDARWVRDVMHEVTVNMLGKVNLVV